jgi:hypothetical protein
MVRIHAKAIHTKLQKLCSFIRDHKTQFISFIMIWVQQWKFFSPLDATDEFEVINQTIY